jgi:hypothetical protein
METFGGVRGVENASAGILGENREMGWKALPSDAPEWVKTAVAEGRQAVLEGRPAEYTGPNGERRTVQAAMDEILAWETRATQALADGAFEISKS